MRNVRITGIAILAMACSVAQAAPEVSVSGMARIRSEAKNNADFNKTSSDRVDFTTSRIQLSTTVKQGDDWTFFFQPQFVRIWGQNDIVPTSTTANTSTQTSGGLHDSNLTVHQAYLDFKLAGDSTLTAGRQEISYGDQLLLGAVGWSNIGRSFDAARAHVALGAYGKLDVFKAELVDANVTSRTDGDYSLNGLYYMHSLGEYVKSFDLYYFNKADHRTSNGTPSENINTYGARLKSKVADFDYRVEYSAQSGRIPTGTAKKNSESQYDVELGYSLAPLKTRLAVEMFNSSEFFDQLYPTAHKWLGFADQFARRNISGYAAHLSLWPTDELSFLVDYHMFKRTKTTSGAYKFNASTPYGTTGTEKDIASEIDVTLNYKLRENLRLSALYATVAPGKYLKAQSAAQKDATSYTYLEIQASF